MTKTNKKIIIISIFVVVIILVVIFYFLYREKKSGKDSAEKTTTTTTTAEPYKYTFADEQSVFEENNNQVQIDYNNGTLRYGEKTYYLGDLKNAHPIFSFSPSGNYAVGQFFLIEDGEYYHYLLSTQNPQKIDDRVEEIGAVYDDGTMVYFIDGEIRRGSPNSENYTVLVEPSNVESICIGFAQIDKDNLIFWGSPTEPRGHNMYLLDTESGKTTSLIDDDSVMDAKISPDKNYLVVRRYLGDENSIYSPKDVSTWIFSLAEKKFVNRLPVNFEVHTCAWSPDSKSIAYWRENQLFIVDTTNNSAVNVATFPAEYNYQKKILGFIGNKVVILPQ